VKRLYAIGEALIDFIPSAADTPLEEVAAFSPKVGGAPCSVAAIYALLGGKSTVLTAVGKDAFGNKIMNTLRECGVDVSRTVRKSEAKTGLAFVGLDQSGERSFSFYRSPSADLLYSEADLPDTLDDCAVLHFCSVALMESPMKRAHRRAIALAKASGALVSFDVNLRFSLWEDRGALYQAVWEFLPMADIVKLSEEEVAFVTGETSLVRAAKMLLFHCRYVIVTQGEKGATLFYLDNTPEDYGMREVCVGVPETVRAIDTTGAGDAFIGTFLYFLNAAPVPLDAMRSDDFAALLSYANTVAASTTQYPGAIESYRKALSK